MSSITENYSNSKMKKGEIPLPTSSTTISSASRVAGGMMGEEISTKHKCNTNIRK